MAWAFELDVACAPALDQIQKLAEAILIADERMSDKRMLCGRPAARLLPR
jgi:hypothetical protein